jgi:hypothetical protein
MGALLGDGNGAARRLILPGAEAACAVVEEPGGKADFEQVRVVLQEAAQAEAGEGREEEEETGQRGELALGVAVGRGGEVRRGRGFRDGRGLLYIPRVRVFAARLSLF